MEDALTGARPDIIYTHHEGDLNVDHVVVNRAALTLYRPLPKCSVRAIRGFEVLSSTHWNAPSAAFNPSCFVDIARTLDRKTAALAAYGGEVRHFPHARSTAAVEALARVRGAICGVDAAEAFTVIREIDAGFDK
jgi:LmbE family N-acetylglucosaminyl deacetylase